MGPGKTEFDHTFSHTPDFGKGDGFLTLTPTILW